MTGGVCTELRNGEWRPLYGTRSHIGGASRAYRWGCLQEVLPLEERRGWDEIDAIKAQIRGWRVGTLPDLVFDTTVRRDGGTGHPSSAGSGSEARRISWATGGPTSSFVRSGAPFGIHERS